MNRPVGVGVVGAVILLLGTGCVSTPDSGQSNGCLLTRPIPHAGDVVKYSVEGTIDLVYTTFGAVADWRVADDNWSGPNIDHGGVMTLPAGSTLTVEISAETKQRLTMFGHARPSIQVAYVAKHPDHPEPFHFADEWLDAETGDIVQVSLRGMLDWGEQTQHLLRLSRISRPPLFFSTWLTGDIFSPGGARTVESPREILGAQDLGNESLGHTTAGYVVEKLVEENRICRAHVKLAIKEGTGLSWEFETTMNQVVSSKFPVPEQISTVAPATFPWLPAQYKLLEYKQGLGGPLPVWRPTEIVPSLKLFPYSNDFLVEDVVVFPTSFSDARAAAESDSAVSAWLMENSGAEISRVEHVMGENPFASRSAIVDEWTIGWAVPGGDGLQVKVRKQRDIVPSTPLSNNETIDVRSKPVKVDMAVRSTGRVALSAIAQASEFFYGSPIEFLQCDFHRQECWFGPHTATGQMKAGAIGVGTPTTGLRVLVDHGIIYMEESLSNDVLGPPR